MMPQNRTPCWYFIGITTANASPHITQTIDSVAASLADGECASRCLCRLIASTATITASSAIQAAAGASRSTNFDG